ncbi:MAG: Chorismate mutase [uncultured bacterium]|nr:MAG: Chorismate mutase [uncultured bacterium]
MAVRGIRGATTSHADEAAILADTQELLSAILKANPSLKTTDIASAWFTVTSDLQLVHPAKAAREMGWHNVPLMCSSEIDVPGSLSQCVRVLIHWNTDLPQSAVKHVYLHDAVKLRPDLSHAD